MIIEELVPEKYLFTHADEPEAGKAGLIAFAESAEDVSAFLREANEKGQKVVTIGSNTGLTGATYPTQGEHMLSLEKMNRIIGLDEDTLTLTVEAGVTLAQVREFLADTPYFYAPDPGNKNATIGGTAATNAGGMRAIKYGVTKDNIRGFDVVLANGEVMHCGSLNRKASSGYDLKSLFLGSEGTLGVITRLDLKVIPKPLFEKSLLIGFEKLADLAPMIYQVVTSPVEPVALELLEAKGVQYSQAHLGLSLPDVAGNDFLLLTLNANDEESIEASLGELEHIAKENGAVGTLLLYEEMAEQTWAIRDNILNGIYAASTTKMYDPVVPVNKVTELIAESKKNADELNINSAFFGHAGDGNIHVCILQMHYSDDEWVELKAQYEEKMYQLIADLDGLPSAEHGIGYEKKVHLPKFYSEAYMLTLKKIKETLDPNGILNAGRVID